MTRFACPMLLGLIGVAGCAGMDEAAQPKSSPDAGLGKLALLVDKGAAQVGDRIVVSAETGELVETYSWSVAGPGDLGEVEVALVDPKTGWRKVSFEVGKAGTYSVSCTAKLGWGKGQETATAFVQVLPLQAKLRAFSVRIIPPTSADLPPMDHSFEVTEGEDMLGQAWSVPSGISHSFAAADKGKRVEAYLRLLSKVNDPYPRDIFLGTGGSGTPAKVNGTFHALVLPLDTRLAPNLYTNLDAGALSQSWTAELEAGTKLDGQVVYDGKALPGAKVTLHRKDPSGIVVPSSVGVTDASGAFLLEAQKLTGSATLTVVPPAGKGLAIAQVEGLGELTVQQGWKLEYTKTPSILAGGTVRRVDGSKPAPGATLVLTMETDQVATFTVNGGDPVAAKGRFLVTLVSDKDGVLRDPETQSTVLELPKGTYQAELWPGKAETIEQGYRRTTVVLTKSEPFEVRLAPRVRLEGSVLDRDGQPVLATVTATSAGGSFVASTNLSTGKFSMTVDDQTSYALAARPIEAVRLGSFFQAKLEVAGDAALAALTLPRAVLVKGQLRTTSSAAVPDALMRLTCTSPSCASQGILDETQSQANGSFVLRIPTEVP